VSFIISWKLVFSPNSLIVLSFSSFLSHRRNSRITDQLVS